MHGPTRMSFHVPLCFCCGVFVGVHAAAAPVVWTGSTITFSKTGDDDPTIAANQDRLTSNVWITRAGSAQGGIFNIKQEVGYDFAGFLSPVDTTWATVANNPSATITATNFAALNFTTWAVAYGGPGSSLIGNITTANAVVHLVTDDIYLDLKFTQFDSSGLFEYQRSSPAPTGDYNGNHIVDAADYTVWRDTLGQMVTKGTGADGNADGTINSADYDFWKLQFGNPAGSGAGLIEPAVVPEPAAFIPAVTAFSAFAWARRRSHSRAKRAC
jgi:Dockerin type I domain